MNNNLAGISKILSTILYFIAFLFIVYGLIELYQGEDAIVYFLLGGCFGIISTGKKMWDRKKDNEVETNDSDN